MGQNIHLSSVFKIIVLFVGQLSIKWHACVRACVRVRERECKQLFVLPLKNTDPIEMFVVNDFDDQKEGVEQI